VKKLTKYNVEYDQLVNLGSFDIEAKDKHEAEKKAFIHLMKFDRDAYAFVTVNEIDENDDMIETERVGVIKE